MQGLRVVLHTPEHVDQGTAAYRAGLELRARGSYSSLAAVQLGTEPLPLASPPRKGRAHLLLGTGACFSTSGACVMSMGSEKTSCPRLT